MSSFVEDLRCFISHEGYKIVQKHPRYIYKINTLERIKDDFFYTEITLYNTFDFKKVGQEEAIIHVPDWNRYDTDTGVVDFTIATNINKVSSNDILKDLLTEKEIWEDIKSLPHKLTPCGIAVPFSRKKKSP